LLFFSSKRLWLTLSDLVAFGYTITRIVSKACGKDDKKRLSSIKHNHYLSASRPSSTITT
jgi:hypothetical protein